MHKKINFNNCIRIKNSDQNACRVFVGCSFYSFKPFQFSLHGQYRSLLDRRFSHLQTVLDTSSNDTQQNNYHTTEVGRNTQHKLSARVLISSERTLVQNHACSNHNIVCSTDRICVSDPWDWVYLLCSLPKASSDQQRLCHGSQRQALDSFAFCELMCPIFVYFGPWNRYLKLSVSQKFPKWMDLAMKPEKIRKH